MIQKYKWTHTQAMVIPYPYFHGIKIRYNKKSILKSAVPKMFLESLCSE